MCKTSGILIIVGKIKKQSTVETDFLLMDKSQVIHILMAYGRIVSKNKEKF